MWYVIRSDELCHHGIKGQRWGVRRFQNPDGTLTAEGRKRYNVDIEGAQKAYDRAKERFNKADSLDAISKTSFDLDNAERDLKDEKIKEKLNNKSRETKNFTRIKQEYMAKGMSEEEAAVAAYKRQRAEKLFAAAAITAASAATAYAIYRHYDRNVDKIIPKDALLQRVATDGDLAVHDAFYAAQTKGDADSYVGMYGAALANRQVQYGQSANVYQKQIRVDQDIKVASEKTAKNVLQDVASASDKKALSNLLDDYSRQIVPGVNATKRQYSTIQKARFSLRNGKIDSDVYDALNFARSGGGDPSIQPLLQKFDSELKNRGYGAIMDVNDRRLSGYNTRSATIVIDKGKVSVESSRKLPLSEIQEKNVKRSLVALAKEQGKNYSGVTVAGLLGAAGVNYIRNKNETKRNDRIVEEYRKEHPGSKLSYKQIVRNYERSQRQ